MRIGILISGHVPDTLAAKHGDYGSMFSRLLDGHGFAFDSYDVVDMQFPDAVTDADGWLVTGSRHGAYEDLPFIAPLETFIRQAYDAAVPQVGICFGHQIIAQALGGRVEKFRGGWATGATDYDFADSTLTLNAWHQDQVVKRPADATLIASNPFCENAALVYGNRAFTVQPHPEIQNPYLADLISVRGPGIVPEPVLDAARARIGDDLHATEMAHQIAAFFKQPRGSDD